MNRNLNKLENSQIHLTGVTRIRQSHAIWNHLKQQNCEQVTNDKEYQMNKQI